MNVFRALLGETWRELRAQRSLWFILVLFAAGFAFCMSFSIEAQPLRERFAQHANRLGTILMKLGTTGLFDGVMRTSTPLTVAVAEVRDAADGACSARLTFAKPHEIDSSMVAWRRTRFRERTGAWPDWSQGLPTIAPEERAPYLHERFVDHGWSDVAVHAVGPDHDVFDVVVRAADPAHVRATLTLGIAFGAFHVEVEDQAPHALLRAIENAIASKVAGFFGFLVLLLTFAGVFAESMRRGAIDLVLARPVGRTQLVLVRYGAAVLLVLALNATFFALCALGLALRSGAASPHFFACAATPTLLFAVLFPAAMVLGIWMRNANVAALGTMTVWGLALATTQFRDMLPRLFPDGSPAAERALTIAATVLPPVGGLQALNGLLLDPARADFAPFCATLLHATLHALAALALAAWALRRRDL